jgi:hypothetical protein
LKCANNLFAFGILDCTGCFRLDSSSHLKSGFQIWTIVHHCGDLVLIGRFANAIFFKKRWRVVYQGNPANFRHRPVASSLIWKASEAI